MRITTVQPVYRPAIGGCEIYSHALVSRLRERHTVRVITVLNRQEDKLAHPDLWRNCLLHATRGGQRDEVDGVPVHLVSLSALERRLCYPMLRGYRHFETAAMALIERLFAAKIAPLIEDSDIVHVMHGGVSFLGRAAQRAAAARGIPFYFTPVLHEYHGWDHLLRDGAGAKGGRQHFGEQIPYVRKMPATYHDRYWAELARSADGVIALTDHEKGILVREGVAEERIHVTGIGPVVAAGGPSRDELRRRHGIGDAPLVLFLGRKHELKGVVEILQAAEKVWERFPEARFAFVGPVEGSTEAALSRYADHPGVIDLPEVSDAEKSGWYRACDLFVSPSVHESLGGVFLEAWTFGRPIVGGDIPPVREISMSGRTGILVSRRDPGQIAEAVLRLVSDPDEAARLGALGAERVRTRYSWEHIVERTESAFGATS